MDTVTKRKLNSEEIFAVLKVFITEVIGEEFVEDMDISRESSFTKDLEMDSIEIVSFSEKVKVIWMVPQKIAAVLTDWNTGGILSKIEAVEAPKFKS